MQESYLEDNQRFLERQIGEFEQANRQGPSRWNWNIVNVIGDKLAHCSKGKVEKVCCDIIKSQQEFLEK